MDRERSAYFSTIVFLGVGAATAKIKQTSCTYPLTPTAPVLKWVVLYRQSEYRYCQYPGYAVLKLYTCDEF